MEEGKKKKKEEIARSYFNLNQGNHSREASLRLVIVAVEGIPAIAGESFTGNAKEKCLSSLFLSLSPFSVLASPPSVPSPFSLPTQSASCARLLFFKRTSKSLQLVDGLLPFTRENLLLYYGSQRVAQLVGGGDLCSRMFSVQMIFHKRKRV